MNWVRQIQHLKVQIEFKKIISVLVFQKKCNQTTLIAVTRHWDVTVEDIYEWSEKKVYLKAQRDN